MWVEGLSLRDTVIRIAHDEFLKEFVRLRGRPMMDHTFLDKCYNTIQDETWKAVNETLAFYAVDHNLIRPEVLRTDKTVMESNIHYPTDSSLLWDSWRVLTRWIDRARPYVPQVRAHRFHDRKVKRDHLFIARYGSSTNKGRRREVTRRFGRLIESARWVYGIGQTVCAAALKQSSIERDAVVLELNHYLPAVQTVTDAAERANLKGETVPANDRVFSLFEQHAELIIRGRRNKPVEFGHEVFLAQTMEKFILHYEALQEKTHGSILLERVMERHHAQYHMYPEVIAADHEFLPSKDKREEVFEKIEIAAIPERVADWKNEESLSMASVPCGDRGLDFRPKTGISVAEVRFSRI